MPRVEFEPMIPVFERAKIVHALDRAATVIGGSCLKSRKCMAIYATSAHSLTRVGRIAPLLRCTEVSLYNLPASLFHLYIIFLVKRIFSLPFDGLIPVQANVCRDVSE
jgi:hypothetical protein